MNKLSLLFLLSILTACGGGGGGGGGSEAISSDSSNQSNSNNQSTPDEEIPVVEESSLIRFTPSQIRQKVGLGDSVRVSVQAELITELDRDVYLVIEESSGVIGELFIHPLSSVNYAGSFRTVDSLPLGTTTGQVVVSVCFDELCESEAEGSPVTLPFSIEVIEQENVTDLVPIPGGSDWEMFGGDREHSGYVPITVDVSKISPRASWELPEDWTGLSGVSSHDNKVFFTSTNELNNQAKVHSLNEADFSEVWSKELSGDIFTPSVSSGKVFVATTGHDDSFMYSFDHSSGEEMSKVAFPFQWGRVQAPTISNGHVLSSGAYYAGYRNFNFSDGQLVWEKNISDDYFYSYLWTPAADDSNYYLFYDGELKVRNLSDGSDNYSIRGSANVSNTKTPIKVGDAILAVEPGDFIFNSKISSLNLTDRNENWVISGDFSDPVADSQNFYVISSVPEYGYRLEVRDLETGQVIWTLDFDQNQWVLGFGMSPGVVTNNVLFIRSPHRVYAIDLERRQIVWEYWLGANQMSISSNGILYLSTSSSTPGFITEDIVTTRFIRAINLH